MKCHKSGTGRQRTIRTAVVLLVAVISLWHPVMAEVADAHHGPDSMFPTANYSPTCVDGTMGNTFCRTDNAALTYGLEASVPGAQQTIVHNVMTGQYNPTDLNTSHQNPIVYTGSAETDTVVQVDGGVPSGLDGIAWCDDAISSTTCDQHYARFRTAAVMNNTGLVCHEIGHTVGLTHPTDASPASADNTDANYGCMRTPVANGTALGAHNVQQINAQY